MLGRTEQQVIAQGDDGSSAPGAPEMIENHGVSARRAGTQVIAEDKAVHWKWTHLK